MRPLYLLFAGLAACSPVPPTAMPSAPPPESDAVQPASPQSAVGLASGQQAFAVDLFQRLAAAQPGNLFYSPFSVAGALTMAAAGAEGQTADQMRTVLRLPSQPDAAWQDALRALQPTDTLYTLATANAAWIGQIFALRPAYRARLTGAYEAEARNVDFAQNVAAAQEINGWVAENTRDRIRDLVPADALDANTGLVLTNAVYFKAGWTSPFPAALTEPRPFYRDGQAAQHVPTMHQTDRFRYAEDGGVQVLELPYARGELAMVVVLPKRRDGLAAVRQSLNAAQLTRWHEALRSRRVEVALPRFKLETSYTLNDPLVALGMTDAFSKDRADFAGMAALPPSRRLFISSVLHKAFVEVQEKGTEAAAATAVLMSLTSAAPGPPPQVTSFRAEHPFLFYIRHQQTGLLLFMGQVTDPAAGS